MENGCHSPSHLHAGRSFRRRLWPLLCVVAALSCTLWPIPDSASPAGKPSAYDVEAAYLFNFGKFVTWPASTIAPDHPVTICVLGSDPFGPILDRTIAGETINGKSVVDKRIVRPEEASTCSILYISPSEASRLSRILLAVKDAPVLTVSDMPDFLEHGGMIQFVLRENRVRFSVNLQPAHSDGLRLSSELLKVAVEVRHAEGSQ